jgi:hypothetical protein
MLRALPFTLLIALGMAASGCGGSPKSGSQSNSDEGGPTQTTKVVVRPATANVYQGMTAKFHAQVVGKSNQRVTWNLPKGSLGTIDSTGLYTAPRDASGGPFSVVAASQAVPSAVGSAAVTVLDPQVTVAPATITLALGETHTFTANVKGLANTQVTWSVQEISGGSVSSAGLYNAPQSMGFYHLVASSVANATFTASAIITVTTSAGRFTPTGSMRSGHGSHTGTLLVNGKVLIAGGAIYEPDPWCPVGMASAELYDWTVGSFSQIGSMTSPRYGHTATPLSNGEVLITGGFGSTDDCEDLGTPILSSAELYDPSHGSFNATGSMMEERAGHTATLLPGGKVLVAGGMEGSGSKTAEIYDPQTRGFSSTGDMSIRRSSHTATLLSNGKVLIAGGIKPGSKPYSGTATALAEIYDPGTGTFSPTGSMTAARWGHTATLLATGRVLITGG